MVHAPVTPGVVRQLVLALTGLVEDVGPDAHFRWVDDRLVRVPRDCTVLVGDRLFGFVDRVEPFGLFVDLGRIRALLPTPELSWTPIGHPSEVAHVGDEVEFIAIHLVDPPREDGVRIRGSVRALIPDSGTLEQEA